MTDIGVSIFRFENNRGYGVPDINARYVESVEGVRLAYLVQRRVAAAPPRHPTYLLGCFSQPLELTSTRASMDNLLSWGCSCLGQATERELLGC